MELPGGGDEWLAPSPSPPGPAVPDRHDEHGVGTFIWPPVGTSTWPPVGTFSWPRTSAAIESGNVIQQGGWGACFSVQLSSRQPSPWLRSVGHHRLAQRPSLRRHPELSPSVMN